MKIIKMEQHNDFTKLLMAFDELKTAMFNFGVNSELMNEFENLRDKTINEVKLKEVL